LIPGIFHPQQVCENQYCPYGIVHFQAEGYSNNIHVFEGMFDLLTYRTMLATCGNDEDFIVLNSTTMARHAATLIQSDIKLNHKRFLLWFNNEKENSKASESVWRATEYFTALDCQVNSANGNYEGYSDLNAYWTDTKTCFTPKLVNLKVGINMPDMSI